MLSLENGLPHSKWRCSPDMAAPGARLAPRLGSALLACVSLGLAWGQHVVGAPLLLLGWNGLEWALGAWPHGTPLSFLSEEDPPAHRRGRWRCSCADSCPEHLLCVRRTPAAGSAGPAPHSSFPWGVPSPGADSQKHPEGEALDGRGKKLWEAREAQVTWPQGHTQHQGPAGRGNGTADFRLRAPLSDGLSPLFPAGPVPAARPRVKPGTSWTSSLKR